MEAFGLAFWVTLVFVGVALGFHFHFRKKRRYEMEYNLLNIFAKEHDGTISIHDTWDKIHIGMDGQESHKLFFIRESAGNETREAIDLAGFRNCKLEKQVKIYSNNKGKVEIIEKIDLVCSFIDKGKPSVRLEFYNNDYDALTLSGELQLAMKWEEIVRKAISGIREGVPAGPSTSNPARTAMTG